MIQCEFQSHNKCTHKDDTIQLQSTTLTPFITKYWTKINLPNKVKYRADTKQFKHFYNHALLQKDYLNKNMKEYKELEILTEWIREILFNENINCFSFYCTIK